MTTFDRDPPAPSAARPAGIAMMLLAMVLVGSTVVASDVIGEGMSPFQGTALRFGVAGLGFAALWVLRGERLPPLSRRDWTVLILQSAIGSFAFSILLIVGLYFTAGANASVVVGTLPAVMGLMAFLVLGERLGAVRAAATALATVAVALVTLTGGEGAAGSIDSLPRVAIDGRAVLGTALLLLAVVCEAVFLLLNRALHTPIPAFQVAALMCAFGFAFGTIGAAVEWLFAAPPAPSAAAVLGAVYYGMVPTLIGFPLWYGGSARSTAADAALATAAMPVAAIALSALVLGETVTMAQVAGCALVVAAIAVGAWRPTR